MSKDKKVEQLIVLGNGSDINSGLPSSFYDYIQYLQEKYKILDNMKSIEKSYSNLQSNLKHESVSNYVQTRYFNNWFESTKVLENNNFWLFLLILENSTEAEWYDVERTIKDFLIKKINSNIKSDIKLDLFQKIIDETNEKSLEESLSLESLREKDLLIFETMRVMMGENYKDVFSFLFDQLNDFEHSFSNYILESVKKSDYLPRNNMLIKKICNKHLSNILTFNYTPIIDNSEHDNVKDYINKLENIHGNVINEVRFNMESPVIIGIDSNYDSKNIISKEDKSKIDIFTKTSRLLDFSNRDENKVLDKDVNTIIFFGHSLGEADYSYFQSIFDYYQIYDSDIKIIFLYSEYAEQSEKIRELVLDYNNASDENKENKKQKYYNELKRVDISRKSSQKIKVFKLLNEYGETLNNKNHGRNLLHKLLLERRIELLNIRYINSTVL